MAEIAKLGISVDSRDAIDGLNKIERRLKDTGDAAVTTGAKGSKGLKKLTGSTKRAGLAAQKSAVGFEQLKRSVFSLKGAFVGFTGFAIFAGATKTIASFQHSMAGVAAVTGATGEAFDSLTNKARELGAVTSFSAVEAADGMRFLGQAGFKTDEVISAIGPSLKLAQVGMLDLASAADIVSNIMSGFGIAAEKTSDVANVLAITAANANTNIQQMGEAMKFVAPVAAATGQSVEDLAALVGVLGNAGLQSTLAGTGLRMSMLALLKPTNAAKVAIKELGLGLDDLDPSSNNIIEIMQKLSDANISAAQAATIFGARAATSVLAIMGQGEALKELLEKTHNADGALDSMSATMEDTLQGAMKRATSALVEFTLQAGDKGLASALRNTVDLITDTISALNGMLDPLEDNNNAAFILADTLKIVGFALAALAASKVIVFFYAMATAVYAQVSAMVILAIGTKATAGRLNLVTGAMVGATAATGGLSAAFGLLTAAMVANPVAALAVALAAGGVAFLAYKSKVSDTSDELKNLRKEIDLTAKAMNPFSHLTRTQAITAIAELENTLAGAKLTYERMRELFNKGDISADAFLAVEKTTQNLEEQILKLNEILIKTKDPVADLAEELGRLTTEEKELIESLLVGQTAAKQWAEQYAALEFARSKGNSGFTEEQYQLAIENLNDALFDTIIITEKVNKTTKKEMSAVAQIYKDTASGIQKAFSTTFREVFDDGFSSFDKLSDRILSTFKDMLAQMLTLAIANPIMIPLVQSLGSGLGLGSGDIGAVVAQLGGGGGSGLGGLSALGGVAGSLGAFGSGIGVGFGTGLGGIQAGFTAAGTGAVAGGVGTMVGAALPFIGGALAVDKLTGGALFGGKTKTTDRGFELDVAGTSVTGQEFTSFSKKKSAFRGTKRWTAFKDLSDDAQASLNAAMDSVVTALETFSGMTGQDLLSNLEGFKRSFKGTTEEAEEFMGLTTKDMFVEAFKNIGDPTVVNVAKQGIEGRLEAYTSSRDLLLGQFEGREDNFYERASQKIRLDPFDKSIADLTLRSSQLSDMLTPLQAAMENIDFSNLEQALKDVGFAVAFVTGSLFKQDERSAAKIAIDNLNMSFDNIAEKATSLGLSLTALENERSKQLIKMTTDFNRSIKDQILSLEDPLAFELQQFEKLASERVKNAIDFGADIVTVEKLNALERENILKQSGIALADLLRATEDYNSSLDTQIKRSKLADKALALFDLDQWLLSAKEDAEKVNGDLLKLDEFYNIKRNKILDDYNNIALDEAQRVADEQQAIQDTLHQSQLSNLEKLVSAELRAERDRLGAVSRLSDFVTGLSFSSVSPLFAKERLDVSQTLFQDLLDKAQSGNVDAINSLADASNTYLTEARSYFGGTEKFVDIFDRVGSQLSGIIQTQQDPVVESLNNALAQDLENTAAIVDELKALASLLSDIKAENTALNNNLVRVVSGIAA